MRDLPIPASPEISTIWPWPCHAVCWRESTNSISALRPTKPIERAVRTASKRLSDAAPLSTAQTAMGSEMPLTSRQPRLRKMNRSPSSSRVEAATTTAPGPARPPRLDVRHTSDHSPLLCRSSADEVADHHQPGRDRDPHLDPFRARFERPYSGDDVEPRPYCALRVVLMCAGVAKI